MNEKKYLPSSTKTGKSLKTNGLPVISNKKSNISKPVQREKLHAMDKKNLSQFRLFTAGDDLTKSWFVEYYEFKGKVKIRKQVKGGINRGKTIEERYELGNLLIESLKAKIAPADISGYGSQKLGFLLRGVLMERCTGLRKKSIQSYNAKLNTFLNWCDVSGINYPHQFTDEKCKSFFTFLKSRGLALSTIDNYRERLKPLFSDLVGVNNPFSKIKPLHYTCTPARPYQNHEIAKLKTYIQDNDPQLWFFIQFIINCLIRPNSELRLLKVGHIDFEQKMILIPADISKNKKPQWVVIPDNLFLEVEKLKVYPQDYFLFSKIGVPHTEGVGYNYFYNQHRKILKELGFFKKGYNLYSYKHYGALTMVRAGVPLMEIKEQGRWHSLDQMTDYLKGFGIKDMGNMRKFKGG